jgi:YD repeat-containing protein
MSNQNHISPRPNQYAAANKLPHFKSGVDSRTGNFQASVVLGTVVSGIQDPAVFSLTLLLGTSVHITSKLISGATSQNAIEFGFNIPRIVMDTETPALSKIYFSNGEVDELVYNAAQNTLTTRYHKANTLKIERYRHATHTHLTQGFKVSYKDGRIEYYNAQGRITHLYSASGAGLWFEYGDGLIPLQKVRNEDGSNYIEWSSRALPGGNQGDRLVTVTEVMDGLSTIIKYDLKCREESATPFNQIYYVSRVSLPNDFERWITCEYRKPPSFDYYVLSGVSTPLGLYQVVAEYDAPRRFSAEIRYPVVKRIHEQNMFGFRVNTYDIAEINYEYSADKNYTGYASGRVQVAGVDNCIKRTDDYRYSSWEKYSDRHIKRTYNRFHLLVEEVVTAKPDSLSTRITTTYTYPLVAGNIDRQPANFSFWTQKTTCYTKGESSRTVTEAREYDSYGNVVSETQDSGIKQIHTYYPSTSTERRGCPPSPLFIRHLKKTTINPDPSAEHQATAKTLEYSYTQVNGRTHTNPITGALTSPYMAMLAKEKTNGLLIRENTYRTALDTPSLLGVLISSRTSSPKFINTKEYSWALADQRVIVTTSHVVETVPSAQGQSAGATTAVPVAKTTQTAAGGSLKYSPSSGRVYEEVSAFGATTRYTYNDKGFLTEKISYAGTAQQETESYQFTYWTTPFKDNPETLSTENTIWANVMTTRNSAGLVKHDFLNRDGLVIYEGYAVSGGIDDEIGSLDFSKISRAVRYDRTGPAALMAADTYYDFMDGDEETPSTTETTEFKYILGQLTETAYPNGQRNSISYDFAETPPGIQTRSSNSDTAYRERFDKYGQVKDQSVVFPTNPDATEISLRQNIHDGLGRLVRTRAAFDQAFTHYELDAFDRVTRSTFKNDVTTYEYSAHLPTMDMPVRLTGTFNGVTTIVAARTFDGFGRVTSQVTPGADVITNTVTEHYTYDSHVAEAPSVVTLTAGRIDKSYDPLTGALLSSSNTAIANADSAYSYVFDPVTKQLQSSTSRMLGRSWCTHTYSHNVYGAVIAEDRTYTQGQNTLRVSTAKTYSAFSARLKSMEFCYRFNSVLAGVQYAYDSIGRVSQLDYQLGAFGTIKANIEYGTSQLGGGKISQVKLKVERLLNPALEMKLNIEYASSGFEKLRTYLINQTTILQHGQQHFSSGLQSSNELTRPGSAKRTMEYTYKDKSLHESTTAISGNSSVIQYGTRGFFRFGSITSASSISNYIYQSDRVKSVTETSLTGSPLNNQRYAYNANGNVSTINNAEALTYNAANQLTRLTTASVPTPSTEYQYFYNPEGQLAQVLSANESLTYIYDGDVLMGEISIIGTARVETFYLRANGVLLGRYIKKATAEELELYGVDPSGTVLCAYTYSAQGVELRHEHYDYTDFGERSTRSA